jgi:hypothetical protein
MANKVLLRPATPSDLLQICLLSAESFKSHHNIRIIHPYISKYPKDFLRGETYGCKAYFYCRGVHTFVLEVEDIDGEDGDNRENVETEGKGTIRGTNGKKIVGYAMWGRTGKSDAAKGWRKQPISRGMYNFILLHIITH